MRITQFFTFAVTDILRKEILRAKLSVILNYTSMNKVRTI